MESREQAQDLDVARRTLIEASKADRAKPVQEVPIPLRARGALSELLDADGADST